MRRSIPFLVVLWCSILSLHGNLFAQTNFTVTLTPETEVPPVPVESEGRGGGVFDVKTAGGTLSFVGLSV